MLSLYCIIIEIGSWKWNTVIIKSKICDIGLASCGAGRQDHTQARKRYMPLLWGLKMHTNILNRPPYSQAYRSGGIHKKTPSVICCMLAAS